MRHLIVVAFCIMCLFCAGCGSDVDLGQVTGTVTMDDVPVDGAIVTFTPAEGGRASVGKTNEMGVYNLAFGADPGALIGMHKVAVRKTSGNAAPAVDPNMSSDSEEYMKQAMGGSAADYDNATTSEEIPSEYNTESILEFEVKSGKNTIDIKMTSN